MTEYGHKYGTLDKEKDIKKIMDTWTVQSGYPVVTVSRTGSDVTISQHKYALPEINVEDKTRWFIPITFETKAQRTQNSIPTLWLSNSENITILNMVEPTDWMYVNINRSGYYRVNYDYNSWIILVRNFNQFPEVTRAQLIDDSLHLARAEVLSYDIPLTFLLKLNEKEILAWAAVSSGIGYLTDMLNREPAYEYFRVSGIYAINTVLYIYS